MTPTPPDSPPRTAPHTVVAVTLSIAGAALIAAGWLVEALARDKASTALHLVENGAAQVNGDGPAQPAAGDPSSPFAGDDLAAAEEAGNGQD